MIVFSEGDKRNMRALAASEQRPQITRMLELQKNSRAQLEEGIRSNEQWISDRREHLAQVERNIAVIEEILSEVLA